MYAGVKEDMGFCQAKLVLINQKSPRADAGFHHHPHHKCLQNSLIRQKAISPYSPSDVTSRTQSCQKLQRPHRSVAPRKQTHRSAALPTHRDRAHGRASHSKSKSISSTHTSSSTSQIFPLQKLAGSGSNLIPQPTQTMARCLT